MQKINLAAKLAQIGTHWDPKIVASYNGNDVMVVKFQGEFPYHSHAETDDFFLVLAGEVVMDFDGADNVTFGPGEMLIVPAGTVHRPRAEAEAHVLLIEPMGEPNTGTSGAPAAAKDHI
ncbi:cupin domain-containing protein [Roseovarius sp. S1116L3]|uniref:cupin domain-containing protein n=1 Tax=Roseovarius roseus TaxID=3342636 RepID=UPI00372BB65A